MDNRDHAIQMNFPVTSKIRHNLVASRRWGGILIVFNSMTVSDVDEFTGLMEGWESDWRQLESGMPYNDIQMMAGRDTVLQRVSLSHAVHQQAGMRPV